MVILISIQCTDNTDTPIYTKEQDQKSVMAILKILDDHSIITEEKMHLWVDDLVHMVPNQKIITNKNKLIDHIKEEKKYGFADMKHEITELHSYKEIVVMHGKVNGIFYPANNGAPNKFSTKNLFVFRRMQDNTLKIWKVIYNMTS